MEISTQTDNVFPTTKEITTQTDEVTESTNPHLTKESPKVDLRRVTRSLGRAKLASKVCRVLKNIFVHKLMTVIPFCSYT